MESNNNIFNTQAQQNRNSSESGLLLGLAIVGLVLSLLPAVFILQSLTIGILVFNVICLVLAIALLVRSNRTTGAGRGRYIAAITVSTIAILLVIVLQFVILPLIDSGLKNTACSLQTVVDPVECGADYKLAPGQEFKQN